MAKKAVKKSAPAKKPAKDAKAPPRGSATPKPSKKAELIVRQGFMIDATGGAAVAIPEVVLLANQDGFRYLADMFAHLAEQAGAKSRDTQAAEGLALPRGVTPVNVRLSDDMDFRFAPLTAANRAATLKRYGVTLKSRQKGSLFDRYQNVAEEQYQKVARKIAAPQRET